MTTHARTYSRLRELLTSRRAAAHRPKHRHNALTIALELDRRYDALVARMGRAA